MTSLHPRDSADLMAEIERAKAHAAIARDLMIRIAVGMILGPVVLVIGWLLLMWAVVH